ncbi:MAG: class I SAM-dependent methyltransferase [Anaerolineales bacterium]
MIDKKATRQTQELYQRISGIYDLMESAAEILFRPWRERVWALAEGPQFLDLGVGTGKNMPYYPEGAHITGVDLTPGMLAQAKKRAARLGLDVDLQLGDAQALEFPEDSFDTAVATFVFCSVPDPVLGFKELGRVVKPDGKILLLDHVRSEINPLGPFMDFVNPLTVRITGANINRRTVDNAQKAGLHLDRVENVGFMDIFKLTIARPGN